MIDRTIDDGTRMNGLATFDPRGDGWFDFQEKGECLLPNGARNDFYKSYQYQVNEAGFSIFFDEEQPRLFQEVVLTNKDGGHLCGVAHHDCPPDTYQSAYKIMDSNTMIVSHRVTGPRKNYTIGTVFERAE